LPFAHRLLHPAQEPCGFVAGFLHSAFSLLPWQLMFPNPQYLPARPASRKKSRDDFSSRPLLSAFSFQHFSF